METLLPAYTPDPEFLSGRILNLYAPAPSVPAADDLITNLELMEQLHQFDDMLSSKHVYDAMLELNFKHCNIEGTLYWMVMLA